LLNVRLIYEQIEAARSYLQGEAIGDVVDYVDFARNSETVVKGVKSALGSLHGDLDLDCGSEC